MVLINEPVSTQSLRVNDADVVVAPQPVITVVLESSTSLLLTRPFAPLAEIEDSSEIEYMDDVDYDEVVAAAQALCGDDGDLSETA